jgi:RNA polymerase-binding transcription factor DksA
MDTDAAGSGVTAPAARPAARPSEPGPAPELDEVTTVEIDAIDDLLDGVEEALARIDAGTYGHCRACGLPIADDRLADAPTATTCAGCDERERRSDHMAEPQGRQDVPDEESDADPGRPGVASAYAVD